MIGRDQKVWVGSYYGGLSRYDGKTFKTYKHNSADPESIADDSIWELFEDSRRNIWIGTLDGGLDRLDPETGKFTHYPSGGPHSN